MRGALTVFLLLLFISAPAWAQAPSAWAAYESGAYGEAARAGEARGDAEGLALAARARLAEGVIDPRTMTDDELDRAAADAQQAIALDPDAVDARLSLAVALGMKGRRVSLAEAWRRGYAQKGRRLIGEALKRDPDNARAQAMLGAWHLEVIRRAGLTGAMFLGARVERGVAAFDAARKAAPDDPAIALHYAIALLALDPRKHAGEARDLLAAAAASTPRDAFETATREEARRLGAVLATAGALAAAQLVSDRYM
ncbi:MAG TPA: hypothetical protein VG983_11150 [Caulobacterales bacterium]|nr:hypothetical protein [Caulobacterales bacterium]